MIIKIIKQKAIRYGVAAFVGDIVKVEEQVGKNLINKRFAVKADAEATKSAKALAEKEGIDINEIEGSGKDGKVIKKDVQDVL